MSKMLPLAFASRSPCSGSGSRKATTSSVDRHGGEAERRLADAHDGARRAAAARRSACDGAGAAIGELDDRIGRVAVAVQVDRRIVDRLLHDEGVQLPRSG